jgi:hypothetical protein
MHDAMNITSSHNANFDQFHIKATYIITLSCFIWRMKFERCLGINFDDLLDTIGTYYDTKQNIRPENLSLYRGLS